MTSERLLKAINFLDQGKPTEEAFKKKLYEIYELENLSYRDRLFEVSTLLSSKNGNYQIANIFDILFDLIENAKREVYNQWQKDYAEIAQSENGEKIEETYPDL